MRDRAAARILTPINAPTQTRMTVEAFLAWSQTWAEGERYELWRGVPVRMSPERARHALVKMDLAVALQAAVAAAGLDATVFPVGMSVRIAGDTAFEPDAAVCMGRPRNLDAMLAEAPVVLAEVLSPSTSGVDTGRKLAGYFGLASPRHYLILDPEARQVTWHARRDDGRIETAVVAEGTLALDPLGLTVAVAAFVARV